MSDVHLILPFAHHLISVDVTGVVKIWVIKEQGLVCLHFVLFSVIHVNDIIIRLLRIVVRRTTGCIKQKKIRIHKC